MRIYPRHDWRLGYAEAVALQKELAAEVRLESLPLRAVRRVAGADVAVSRAAKTAAAAVVVFEFPSLAVVEERVARGVLEFPYVPGLLSFREIPVLIECLRGIETPFDAILCDGQGIAHPRRFGLASHLGLILRKPAIGCAKSLLVGEFGRVGANRGDFAPLWHDGKRTGSVLRTQDGVKPIFVSPGHLADQRSSRAIALACAPRHRIPEPTRRADHLAGMERRRIDSED
jgi:deoxyribonuclease V